MAENSLVNTNNDGYAMVKNFTDDKGFLEELKGLPDIYEKVTIPTGGGLSFEVKNEDGEVEPVTEIEGVILHHHPINAYYEEKYTGGNNPPDCCSYDGDIGEGEPGGVCKTCEFNKFGTDGTGKACKNKRRVYILKQGELFPILLSVPVGSMKEFNSYVRRTFSKRIRTSDVVTKITLKKAQNSTGITYSQLAFSRKRKLSKEEIEALDTLVEYTKDLSRHVSFDADEEIVNDITDGTEPVEEVRPLH